MKLHNIDDIIAVRRLRLLGEPDREIVLKLGRPQLSPDSLEYEEYYCPYQIAGAGDERVRYAAGVDAFQALQLALTLIGPALSRLKGELDGRLQWDYDDAGGFGFPNAGS